MRRVAIRRLESGAIHNKTNTASFDKFIIRMGTDELGHTLPHSTLIKSV
jgi:hypothetical protein